MELNRKTSSYLLVLLTLLSLGFGSQLPVLRFNYDIETLFPEEDPELAFFRDFRAQFENENDYLALGIVREAGIFQLPFLLQIDSLTQQLSRLPAVEAVSALTNTRYLKITPLGGKQNQRLLHIDRPDRLKQDSVFLYAVPQFIDNLFSRDGKSLCVYLRIQQNLSVAAGDSLLNQIQALLPLYPFEEVHLSGGLYNQRIQTQMVQREMWRFGILSILLIVLSLGLIFRSVWGVVAPLGVIGLSVVWTAGLMAWWGVEINVMTVLIPSILFVVGMSDVVHLFNRYLEELRAGHSQKVALRLTLKEVGLATFLTSLTTALGFLTLMGAGIAPYRQLGGFAALGVLIAYGLTFTLLPALLVLLPRPRSGAFVRQARHWDWGLHRLLRWILQYRRHVWGSAGIVLVLSLIGLAQLRIEAFVSDELSPHTTLYQDTRFFDTQYGGVRPFALSVSVLPAEADLFSLAVLAELERLDRYLTEVYAVNRLYSLLGNLKAANSSLNNGSPHFYRLPRSAKARQDLVSQVQLYGEDNGLYNLLTRDHRLTRVTGSVPDWGLQVMEQKNAALETFIADSIDGQLLSIRLTGSARLFDRSHHWVVRNMLTGLSLGILVVALLMGLLYRSWRMSSVALLVNLLPLLMVGGLMGVLGIGLKMSTAMIFAIAFGIAVDDTIHFISKLKIELNQGKSLPVAIKGTFLTTGKAIILTSLVVSAGFLVLMSSDFQGTFLTGLLVSLTLLFAMIVDLILLPVLLLRIGLPSAGSSLSRPD